MATNVDTAITVAARKGQIFTMSDGNLVAVYYNGTNWGYRIKASGTWGSRTALTSSPAATGACWAQDLVLATGDTSNGSSSITNVSPTTGFANGQPISGPGIPAGTTISSGAGTSTLVLSQNATATATGVSIKAGGDNIFGAVTGTVASASVYVYKLAYNASTDAITQTNNLTGDNVPVLGVYLDMANARFIVAEQLTSAGVYLYGFATSNLASSFTGGAVQVTAGSPPTTGQDDTTWTIAGAGAGTWYLAWFTTAGATAFNVVTLVTSATGITSQTAETSEPALAANCAGLDAIYDGTNITFVANQNNAALRVTRRTAANTYDSWSTLVTETIAGKPSLARKTGGGDLMAAYRSNASQANGEIAYFKRLSGTWDTSKTTLAGGASTGWLNPVLAPTDVNQSTPGTIPVANLTGTANPWTFVEDSAVIASAAVDATVTAVVADATGAAPASAVSAGSSVAGVPADATGSAPVAAVEGIALTTDQLGAADIVQVGLAHQYQRGTFTAAGRDWVVYADQGALTDVAMLLASTDDDGATWTVEPLRDLDEWDYGNNAYFDTHFDGTHLHYAACGPLESGGSNDVLYRRGTPQSDGTISWDAAEQVAFTGAGSILEVGINTDSDGVPWVCFEHFNAGTGSYPIPKVTKATAADGSWTTDTGFPYTLSTTTTRWWTQVVRLNTTGAMVVFYWHSNFNLDPGAQPTILAQVWDGTGWVGLFGELAVDDPPRADQFGGGRISDFCVASDPDVGEAYAVWYDTTVDEFTMAKIDISGLYPSAVIGNGESALYVTAAIGVDTGNDELVLVYSNNDTELRIARRSSGGTWGASTQLANDPVRRSSLQITERGSRLVVAYQENAGTAREPIRAMFLGSGGTDATVAAVVADAAGDAPVASAAASAGATVTAVVATAPGSAPIATVAASMTVTAVVADAAGSAPPANQLISAVITAPVALAAGAGVPASAVGEPVGGATVTGVVASSLGSGPPATVSSAQVLAAAVADATGAGLAGSVSLGASVAGVPASATGSAPRPSVSPAPVGGAGSALVAVAFAEDAA